MRKMQICVDVVHWFVCPTSFFLLCEMMFDSVQWKYRMYTTKFCIAMLSFSWLVFSSKCYYLTKLLYLEAMGLHSKRLISCFITCSQMCFWNIRKVLHCMLTLVHKTWHYHRNAMWGYARRENKYSLITTTNTCCLTPGYKMSCGIMD